MSAVTRPFRTRKRLMRPANGSATVLKTKTRGRSAVDVDRRALLRGRGNTLDEQVEQRVRAEVLRRNAAGDREHLALRHRGLERRRDLVRVELLAFEVALHEPLVRLDDGVEELLAVLGRDVRHLVRDRARLALLRALGARVRAHVQDVDDAGQLVLDADRDVHGDALRARAGSEAARAFGRSRRARGRACSRRRRARGRAPRRASRRATVPTSTPITPDTVTSIPSTTRAAVRSSPWKLGSPGTSIRLSFRSCQVACVSDIAIESCRLCSSSSAVRDRRAGLDRAEPVHRARLEEERLDERRLPRPAVADDGDVADLGGLGHGLLVLLGLGFGESLVSSSRHPAPTIESLRRRQCASSSLQRRRASTRRKSRWLRSRPARAARPRDAPSGAGSPSCAAARRATR